MSDDPTYTYREWALMKLMFRDGHTYETACQILRGIEDEDTSDQRPYKDWTQLLGERQ